ncbi:tRNA (guanine(10)-N2)-methyltransferase-like protein isoform X1 [Iris pallida]|uniref:tRNA (Guanine(10)-N2)-methyltransferase-like protein isoform X1 n=1 Tax=Iris pallida TaxID=29817 RepID=A0AAX6FUS4_IRIPA|nr:tRNA (guanine(10)-N2)-methyltransferase-like protein isoform X1 [Iris pallida]
MRKGLIIYRQLHLIVWSSACMTFSTLLPKCMLVMGGRLVFFYPVLREEGFTDAQYPEHPCFTLVASCEQILSLRYSRHLLTMAKTGSYTEEIAESARLKHLEFTENHLKWLEEGNLHSAVFSPADSQAPLAGQPKFDRDSKPKYRGKYV